MNKGFELHTTHEGRVRITTFGILRSWKVSLLLMFRYGFYRWGAIVPRITDEAIYPDYIRGKLKIKTGWDIWFGYDWFFHSADGVNGGGADAGSMVAPPLMNSVMWYG